MKKIFVVAGNTKEYEEYVHRNVEWRQHCGEFSANVSDYVYVTHFNLVGIKEPHGVFIGSFRNREDLRDILTALASRYEIGQIPQSIRDLYNEVWSKA